MGTSLTGSPGNCHGRKKIPTIAEQEQSTISGQKNQKNWEYHGCRQKTAIKGGTGDAKHL